uniref:Leucine-rich repeat-containing N-terminal plant-type domain-containing protein n=1 Tax=Lactuca sativa TaxID=4236 RepID=A0A9R1W970_LACSA|nr:hypothetical protein LSAT_V11C300107970 [Lactuca sativa]
MLPICYGEVVFTWQLNGTVPKALGRLENLRVIDISSNGLIGPIPESIGRLRLIGKISKCLGNLGSLTTMIFSSNRLFGVIPSCIALTSSLHRLKLNDNNLIGEVP